MTAQKLANHVALSQLIEFDMESADPRDHLNETHVVHLECEGIDLEALVCDDDFDLMQNEAENDFFQQMQMNRGHRAARRSFQNW